MNTGDGSSEVGFAYSPLTIQLLIASRVLKFNGTHLSGQEVA